MSPAAEAATSKPRRRQARGQRRIELLLDVAAQVFAEVGFEAATTNAIAARAGMSPGSLYQFFPNKDAIAEALADRFAERLRLTQAIFGPEIETLPLDASDRSRHRSFGRVPRGSPRVSGPVHRLDRLTAPCGRDAGVSAGRRWARRRHACGARAALVAERRARCARVSVELVRALLPLVVASEPAERRRWWTELKAAQRGYLEPLFEAGEARSR